LRPASNKSRGQLQASLSSEYTPSNSSKANHLNLSHETSTFYEMPESVPAPPVPTTNGIDVNSLTDDEVRERFKSVMVSIYFLSFFFY